MARKTKNAMSENKDKRGQSVTVYLSGQVIDLVKKDAKDDKRSVSYIVNKILEEHYKTEGKLK
jgi:hypothetical protein